MIFGYSSGNIFCYWLPLFAPAFHDLRFIYVHYMYYGYYIALFGCAAVATNMEEQQLLRLTLVTPYQGPIIGGQAGQIVVSIGKDAEIARIHTIDTTGARNRMRLPISIEE